MRTAPLLVLLAGPLLSGCVVAAAAAAAGGMSYTHHAVKKTHRDFEANFDQTWIAVSEASYELGYPTPERNWQDGLAGESESDDHWVRVERFPDDFTCVAVRIGDFETRFNKDRTREFLDRVAIKLGENPPIERQE